MTEYTMTPEQWAQSDRQRRIATMKGLDSIAGLLGEIAELRKRRTTLRRQELVLTPPSPSAKQKAEHYVAVFGMPIFSYSLFTVSS